MVVTLQDEVDAELREGSREVLTALLVVGVIGVVGRRVDRVVVHERRVPGIATMRLDDVGDVADVCGVSVVGVGVAVDVDEQHVLVDVPVVATGLGRRVALVEGRRTVGVRGPEVLLVCLPADIVVADRRGPRVLTQLVGREEGVPLSLGVGGLDLVSAGDEKFGIRVGSEGDVQGVGPAGTILSSVARRTDLRVTEE